MEGTLVSTWSLLFQQGGRKHPPGYLFSQISIISTAPTSALSQQTGGLTEVLQEDTYWPCHSSEPEENHILSPATLQKINWKPKMSQASPAYFDRLNQHKLYNTSWRNKKRTTIKSTASSRQGQSLNLQLIASITFRAHHRLKHFISPWKKCCFSD